MHIWLLGNTDSSINLYRYSEGDASPLSVASSTSATDRDLNGNAEPKLSAAAALTAVRWRVYSESYVLSYATELVEEERVRRRVRRPFLLR